MGRLFLTVENWRKTCKSLVDCTHTHQHTPMGAFTHKHKYIKKDTHAHTHIDKDTILPHLGHRRTQRSDT